MKVIAGAEHNPKEWTFILEWDALESPPSSYQPRFPDTRYLLDVLLTQPCIHPPLQRSRSPRKLSLLGFGPGPLTCRLVP